MSKGWYNYSQCHALASKGIKTKIPFEGVMANGLQNVELVDLDDIPMYLYHATATKNVDEILKYGLKTGKEESRSIEDFGAFRSVEEQIFFTADPDTSGYFGVQSVQSYYKRLGNKMSKEDMDYTIFRVDTEEFEKYNFHTYLGAELFNQDREYIVKYDVPKDWIDGGIRVFWDKDKNKLVKEGFRIKWDRHSHEVVPFGEMFI